MVKLVSDCSRDHTGITDNGLERARGQPNSTCGTGLKERTVPVALSWSNAEVIVVIANGDFVAVKILLSEKVN